MKNIINIIKRLDKRILYMIIGVIVLIIAIILLILFTPKTLKLSKSEVLLDGFTSNETLVVKIHINKIKSIKLTKEISLSEYYDEYGTYYDSLEKILNNGYSYLGSEYNLKREDYKMIVDIDTKDKGVILNNLSIKYNGDDKTTLRYDIETNLSSETAINTGDKISKVELKSKLSKYGYQ